MEFFEPTPAQAYCGQNKPEYCRCGKPAEKTVVLELCGKYTWRATHRLPYDPKTATDCTFAGRYCGSWKCYFRIRERLIDVFEEAAEKQYWEDLRNQGPVPVGCWE